MARVASTTGYRRAGACAGVPQPVNRRARVSPFILTTAALVALGTRPADAQIGVPRDTGSVPLTRFLDFDSPDPAVKLEEIRHTAYSIDRKMTVLLFLQMHGQHVSFEQVLYPSVDGRLIPAYIVGPREPRGRRPGIVLVHGGYHSSIAETDFGMLRRVADEGYVAIFPEYRGSRGYGKNHYDAIDYAGLDVDDVLAAADYLANMRDDVDASRLGIVGRSRGGLLTLLAIQREPTRFRAAVHIVGLADMLAYMSYKPDYRRQDIARQSRYGGMPFDNLGAYIDATALTHVDRIRTPLLIHATTGDDIVPIELHAWRLIQLLKAHGNNRFEYHIYDYAPGGHLYSHAATPEARDSEARIMAFLRRHLAS